MHFWANGIGGIGLIGAGRDLSARLEPAQRIGGCDDRDILEGLEFEQIKIASDYEIGACRDGAGEYMIIIRIAADWRGQGLWFHYDAKAAVLLHEIGGGQFCELYSLREFVAGDDFGKLG
jgi:hypothetical protein